MALTNKTFPYTFRFDRTTTGSYVNVHGAIRTADIDEPRFEHDPLTGAPLGIRTEAASTNLAVYSEFLSLQSNWVRSQIDRVDEDVETAPDGQVTADLIVENAAASSHSIRQTGSFVSGETYVFSIFARSAGRTALTIQPDSIVFPAGLATFDLSAVTVSEEGASVDAANIQEYKNGWFRCSVTVTAGATASGACRFYLSDTPTPAGIPIYTGDGASGLYMWGAQFENNKYASSYIKTETSTATRGSDLLQLAINGDRNTQEWVNPEQGTVFIELENIEVQATFNYLWSFTEGDSTAGEWFGLAWTGATVRVRSSNNSDIIAFTPSSPLTGRHKIAVSYVSDGLIQIAIDGGEYNSASVSVPIAAAGFNQFKIGRIGSSTPNSQQFTNNIDYWPYAMTQAELEAITT